MINETGAKKVVNDNLEEVVRDQCSSAIDSVQKWSNSAADTVHGRVQQLLDYLASHAEVLNAVGDKLGEVWTEIGIKYHDLAEVVRNHSIHIKITSVAANVRSFLQHGVSPQALYFGAIGLLTGSVIGLCIGYTVRRGSSQLFSTSISNTLMRAILTTNTKRKVDGVTIGTTTMPTLEDPLHVLIQVKAMSVDNIDVKIASGYKNQHRFYLGLPQIREPYILGRECSGVIVDVGHQVSAFDINDRVWVSVPLWAPRGVMAEYIVVPEKYVGMKPKNISFEAAATIPYAAVTLWRKVIIPGKFDAANAKNRRVLVHFGSISKNDGVGLLATQVLRSWGARVTVSITEQSEDFFPTGSGVAQLTFLHSLKSLGAECHLILPSDVSLLPNVAQRIFDVVINTDSSDLTNHLECFCKDPLKDRVYETFVPELGSRTSSLFESVFGFLFSKQKPDEGSSFNILEECRRMIEANMVAPVVAKSFVATQYDQAFRHVVNDSNSALAHVGKNVIIFKQS